MFLHKKHLLVALAFCATSSLFAPKEPTSKDFQQTASQVAATTLAHTQYALLTAAQSFDSLLYPALCLFAGRSVYNNYISNHLTDAPARVHEVEKFIPGGDTARHMATYLAVGAGLFMGFNALTNAQPVNDFLQTYMPNTSNLVTYLKTQFAKTPKAKQKPQDETQIICRK